METEEIPSRLQRKTCWMALFLLAILVIVVLVCGMVYGLGRLFVALEPVLLPIVIAGVLAYLLYPVVIFVQRRVKKRLLAVLLVMLASGVLIAGLGMAIVPPLVHQTGELIANRHRILENAAESGKELLNSNALVQRTVDTIYSKTLKDAATIDLPDSEQEELAHASTYTAKVAAIIDYNSSYIADKALEWLTAGTRAVYGASSFLIGAVMVPVFLFYFLLESEHIVKHWHEILPLRRSRFREEVVGTLQQINGYIVSFVRGQMLVSLIDGVLLGISLKIMGLPYAITIAAAAAFLGIIPYIGMISCSIPALLIAWFTWQDISSVAIVAGIFVAVNQFDGWVIQPRIIGNQVGMHDMTIMFSVLFWGVVLGGIVGALLAVPLTAAIKVIFVRYVWSSHIRQAKGDGGGTRRRKRRHPVHEAGA